MCMYTVFGFAAPGALANNAADTRELDSELERFPYGRAGKWSEIPLDSEGWEVLTRFAYMLQADLPLVLPQTT